MEKSNKKGLTVAVVCLSAVVLILSAITVFLIITDRNRSLEKENNYRKSIYNIAEQVDNMDISMSKVLASNDSSAIQVYLTDIAVNSELACNNLEDLPLDDENKYFTIKLVNQIGDFSKYLNKKYAYNQAVKDEDYAVFITLYQANKNLKEKIKIITDGLKEDEDLSLLKDSTILISNFNEMENLSSTIPQLIYDGPFSDGNTDRVIRGLKKEKISPEKALDIFNSVFNEYALTNIKLDSETDGEIPCYNFTGENNGNILYASVSTYGGDILLFSYSNNCDKNVYGKQDAINKASEFLKDLGYENMKEVWINLSSTVYTINFAVEQNGITVYSDLIKVRVCAETNTVIGLESTSYYTNHFDRETETPVISVETAQQNLSANINVESVSTVIIPIGSVSEKLCYEFSGTYDGSTYYIYIDANSGKQVEMFIVIEGTEGELLM